MPDETSAPVGVRRPRADAARNRARLVEVARLAFAHRGDDASLEGIARAAGVGIGTLYRNFPSRDDLVAAVYASELDAVLATADDLLARHPDEPERALRAFMSRYATFIDAKRGMAESLRSGSLRGAAEAVGTRARVNVTMGRFLDAGQAAGRILPTVSADDVTSAMVGVFLATRDASDAGQVGRLLDLVVRGLRAPD